MTRKGYTCQTTIQIHMNAKSISYYSASLYQIKMHASVKCMMIESYFSDL